jgi:alpha-amylase
MNRLLLDLIARHEGCFKVAFSITDVERDLSAWLGNKLQQAALCELYKLERPVKATENQTLINTWHRLTTSDHFY